MKERLNLARKYRPKTLEDLKGQASVVKILQEALRTDRIAPAYLLSGPRGVGKTSSARILAKAASCLSKDTSKIPCNECAACNAFNNSQLIDIVEIDGASHTGVDDVRSIIDAISYRPNIGRRNVYIIDEVHMLSNAAFNALLKTLEEPPAHALFIFATTELEKVPQTVLSRVQRLELRRLRENDIVASLQEIIKLEKIKASPAVLEQIAAAADGAMRDAQTLLEQMVLLSGSMTVQPEVVDTFLGTIGTEQEIELLEKLAERDSTAVVNKIQDYFDKAKDLSKLLERLVNWTRVLLLNKSCGVLEFLMEEVPVEHSERLNKAFGKWSEEDIDRLFEVLWRGYERMKHSDMPKVTIETCLLRACRIPKTADVARLMSMIQSDSAVSSNQSSARPMGRPVNPSDSSDFSYQPNTRAATAPKKPATPAAPAKTVEKEKIESADDLIQAIKKNRPSLYALVKCAESSELTKEALTLGFAKGHFAVAQLSEKLMRQELEKLMTAICGSQMQLRIEETSAAKPKAAPKRTDFVKEAKKQILSDPEIQKAAEALDGKISGVNVEGIKT